MTDYLKKGEDAAQGDIGAAKTLFLAFLGVVSILGLVMGLVWGVTRNIGSTVREAASDAISSASDSASEAGNTIRVN